MKGKTMNESYTRVRTRFAPQVRFDVETVPFRAGQTTELEQLKERLLRHFPSFERTAPEPGQAADRGYDHSRNRQQGREDPVSLEVARIGR